MLSGLIELFFEITQDHFTNDTSCAVFENDLRSFI
jgi:hypothetical protein